MELLTLAPGSDRIPVELFQILKDDAVESAALNMQYALSMQYAGSRQKQARCPLGDEWIRKLWYIYTMEYYSAIKKNTFESILMRWMKLEPIIQHEVSQKEKQCIKAYIWNLERW